MTDENAKRKYKHLNNIIAGKYSTERYDEKTDPDEEINLDKVSNELLVSDARRHLAQLIKVRPNINFEDTPAPKEKEETNAITIEETKTKSKGKK